MSCLLRPLFFLLLLLGACASPPADVLPTTSAEALVRLGKQAEQLRPQLEAIVPDHSLPAFYAIPAAPNDDAALAQAERLLADSPDILERTVVALMPDNNLPESTKRQLVRQLRQTLRKHPHLDLGWAWLGCLQAADRQFPPDTAMQSFDLAIDYNQQVGFYYKMRGKLRFLRHNYVDASHDYQAAIIRSTAPRNLYKELAAVYEGQQSDQLVTQTWEWVIRDIQRQLPGARQRHAHDPLRRDSVRLLQEELGYSYLARGLYFIETRHKPGRGCPDLQQAAATGLNEATELQQQHCQ